MCLFVCLEVLYLSASSLRGYRRPAFVALPSYKKHVIPLLTSITDVRDSSKLCLAFGFGSSSLVSLLSPWKAGTFSEQPNLVWFEEVLQPSSHYRKANIPLLTGGFLPQNHSFILRIDW